MKVNIGDKVKFLNDIGEGVVTSYMDKKTVMVKTEDDFEMPVLVNELIVMEPAEVTVEKKPERPEKVSDPSAEMEEEEELLMDEEIAIGIKLKKNSAEIQAFLINNSSYYLYYNTGVEKEGEEVRLSGGELEPGIKVYLGKILPENMEKDIRLICSLIFWNKGFYRGLQPVQRKLVLDPSAIVTGLALTDNDYFEQKAAIYVVHSFRKKEESAEDRVSDLKDLKKIIQQKEQPEERKSPPASGKNAPEEVDLHIESILEDYKDLSPGEIIQAQMGRFETSLTTAILHNTRKIVFIHGIGNGKLKHEIRKTLDRKYPDLRYQDASFREYGYGATMVINPGKK